jgi:hypothetical protein
MPRSRIRVIVGEWTGPPNVSRFEKPESSVRKITMCGPFSGRRRGGIRQ